MTRRLDRIALGAYGEDLAAAHLRRDGMRVLDRNWRCPAGELDIVARDRATLVFCEVKTRRSLRFGTPMSAIDAAKAARLRRLATAWLRARPRRRPGERSPLSRFGPGANPRTSHWRAGPRRFDAVCVVVAADGTATVDHRRGVL